MGQRAAPTLDRTEPNRRLVLVIEAEVQAAGSKPEAVIQNTPMPHLAIAIASQELPATPVTAQTLLSLTSAPTFDRTTTPVVIEH